MKGSTLPRLWVPPLPGRQSGDGCVEGCDCGLTPKTSRGFEVIDWAQAKTGLGLRLHPWERWLLVHALELEYDLELYRFRTCLVLVARQNGKTLLKAVLSLWRMLEDGQEYLVGTAQDLSQAREVMMEVLIPMLLAREHLHERFNPEALLPEHRRGLVHRTLNDEYFRIDSRWRGRSALTSTHGPRYLIKALNERAGRGLADVAEVNIDELREQYDWNGWAAISKTMMTNERAQLWAMSNAGSSRSVPLNHLRSVALTGEDPSLFLAEWSAEDGCELDEVSQWAKANPSMGYPGGPSERSIRSAMQQDPPGVFRTEVLCQFVDVLDSAIDQGAWSACADAAGAFSGIERPVVCIESAVEADQVVAFSAGMTSDERVRLNVVGVWSSTAEARNGIMELKSVLRPQALGWFSRGPAARLSATMRKIDAVEIKGEKVAEACMTFSDHVDGRRLLHPDDPLLNAHVMRVSPVGDPKLWMFSRGPSETHAAWAAAGALHLCLNEVRPVKRRRVVIVPD